MDIAEKRVYDANAGRTRLAVATENGLAVVGISADVIGEFGLALREPVRDVVAVGDGRLLVATAEDLLVVALGEGGVAETVATADTGAGPTTAVSIVQGGEHDADAAEDAVIAAGSDGVVRRAALAAVLDAMEGSSSGAGDAESSGPESTATGASVEWTELGEASVRTADGHLLAAADGVYRVGRDAIDHVGLDDVSDVAVPQTTAVDAEGAGGGARGPGSSGAPVGPFAATGDGLYRLGPGWTEELSGEFDLVATADASAVESAEDSPLAHAAAGEELSALTADGWSPVAWPSGSPVAGIDTRPGAVNGVGGSTSGDGDLDRDHPEGDRARRVYAVAADGTVLADAGDGWRTRSIGLPGVVGCAVVE